MSDVVIVSAVRTPTGKFLGALKDFAAPELGAMVVAEAVRRAGLEPALVDECIMGNVVGAGLGQNPARQAALRGGLTDRVAALTINMVCGSGLRAVMLAAQAVAAGDSEVAVAGGMESMSHCPYLLPRARTGLRIGDAPVVDAMINDGLWCAFEQCHMGRSGEVIAEHYGIERASQDAYAVNSHTKAARAVDMGWFRDEILPVSVPQRKGPPLLFERDESVRPDATMSSLGGLKPAFQANGTVTAGNAPGVNDGASALVIMAADRARALGLTPLARIAGQAMSGLPPKFVLMTPVEAVQRVARKVGWSLDQVDLFELNEAFSVQAIAVLRELGIDNERLNVHGGAVALGHAIGSSGSRVLTTLVYAMKRLGKKRGIASLCLGGGNGVAMAIERP